MARKITKKIITHRYTICEVSGMSLVNPYTIDRAEVLGKRELNKMSKDAGKTLVVTNDELISTHYAMDVSTFIQFAEVVTKQENED